MIYIVIKGGMGNQLFQAAFGILIENLTGKNVLFVAPGYVNYSYGFKYELGENFQYSSKKLVDISEIPSTTMLVREPDENIIPSQVLAQVIELCIKNSNLVLDGYWGLEDYYMGYEDLIRELLQPVTQDEYLTGFGKTILATPHIGIHVRRHDYGHHGIACMDYYRNSLKEMRRIMGELPAIVFTDEFNVCNHEFKDISNTKVIKGDSKNPFGDFYLLSKCKHFILANSTFSYWGAFFGEKNDSEIYFPYPYCTFHKNSILGKREKKWHVVDGAVRRA